MPVNVRLEINSNIHLEKTDSEETKGGKEGGDNLGK